MEEEREPLWMPRGSVRAILTLGTFAITAYLVATGSEVPEWWQLTNAGMAGSYFGTRLLANRSQSPAEHNPREQVELEDDVPRAWRNI